MAKKKKFIPSSFFEKDTIRKVVLQWNKMTKKQRENVPTEELEYIRDYAKDLNRSDLFYESSMILNKRISAEMGGTPAEKRMRTKSWNMATKEIFKEMVAEIKELAREKRQINRIKKKLDEVYKITGISPDESSLFIHGIPNKNIIDKGFDAYIKMRLLENELARKYKISTLSDEELIKEEKENWKVALEEARTIDVDNIRKRAIDYLENFLYNRYFLNLPKRNEVIAMIKMYLPYLSVENIYNLVDVLTDDRFKRFWDSDQHTDDENIHELATNRVNDLFKILRNETEMNFIFHDEDNPNNFTLEDYRPTGSTFWIKNFIK